MMECALYGLRAGPLRWAHAVKQRTERVYRNGAARMCADEEHGRHVLTFRDAPDRNKLRTSVVTKISRSVLLDGDPDALAQAIGFTLCSTSVLEVHSFTRSGYQIEMSREAGNAEEPFLVKVFVECDDVIEGEKVIDKAYRELEDMVKVTKPPLTWFV